MGDQRAVEEACRLEIGQRPVVAQPCDLRPGDGEAAQLAHRPDQPVRADPHRMVAEGSDEKDEPTDRGEAQQRKDKRRARAPQRDQQMDHGRLDDHQAQ